MTSDANNTPKKAAADVQQSPAGVLSESQDQRSRTENKAQSAAAPAVVIEDVAAGESTKRGRTTTTTGRNEEDRDLGQDQETDNKVVKGVERLAAHEPKDKESSADYEERTKHERRRRRCPIVTIERFLNNGEDEEEGKEDAVTNRKQRSLARTIMQEDVTGLLRLVQKGACISDNDGHGWTPLHWACSRGSTVMTYAILQEIRLSQAKADSGSERGDDAPDPLDCLNLPEQLNGWTALHLAAIGGHLDVVYQLMEAGCDPQVKDKMGDRPINCIKRTRKLGGVAERLRNALLDLSDTEESTCDESTVPRRAGDKVRTTVGAARPLRRKGQNRERNMHR